MSATSKLNSNLNVYALPFVLMIAGLILDKCNLDKIADDERYGM